MLFLVNAIAMGFIASIWSKSGWVNIFLAMLYVALTVVNAVYAGPYLFHLMGQP